MEPVEVATTMFAGGKGPNIILLLADELRADAVHCIDGQPVQTCGATILDPYLSTSSSHPLVLVMNACGVPVFHPYLGERRVANQDRRMPAEERKPSA